MPMWWVIILQGKVKFGMQDQILTCKAKFKGSLREVSVRTVCNCRSQNSPSEFC